jgi:hypothetical protein
MLKLYRFCWPQRRGGDVEGLFVEDSDVVENAIGSDVYFGEICGKHSDVYGTLDEEDLTVVSEDQEKISWLVDILGRSISGYNPFDYIEDQDELDEEEE